MSLENIFAILFLIFLTLLLLKNKKKIQLQKIFWPFLYIALYKTKLGLNQMDSISKKHPRLVDILSKIGVFVGILGILVIGYMLVKNLFDLLFIPQAVSGVGLVLPFQVKGGFYVPFFYWIISIFFIATIHEFCHGVVARLHNIPVKSSGFAFMGIIVPVIPAAFVEPDEKVMAKRTRMQKLSVFSAGPFSNIATGLLYLIIFLLLSYPVSSNIIQLNGVSVEGFSSNSSSQLSGMPQGVKIVNIDNNIITTVDNLSDVLNSKKTGDVVNVSTSNGTYAVKLGSNPNNSSLPYLGVLVKQSQETKPSFKQKYGDLTASAILWFMGLLYWLYLLSIGIGLFNLVPVGPVDGGQMSREIFGYLFKNEKTAMRWWKYTSLFFFAIIMINLVFGFI